MTTTIFEPSTAATPDQGQTFGSGAPVFRQRQELAPGGSDFHESILLANLGTAAVRLSRPIPIQCERRAGKVIASWQEANISVEESNFGTALIAIQKAILEAARAAMVPVLLEQYLSREQPAT
jgi:hypothetical protein